MKVRTEIKIHILSRKKITKSLEYDDEETSIERERDKERGGGRGFDNERSGSREICKHLMKRCSEEIELVSRVQTLCEYTYSFRHQIHERFLQHLPYTTDFRPTKFPQDGHNPTQRNHHLHMIAFKNESKEKEKRENRQK